MHFLNRTVKCISRICLQCTELVIELVTSECCRSINAALETSESPKSAEEVEEELSEHNALKNVVVICISVIMILHGIVQSGVLVHITVYCQEYLGVSPGFGRYLISCYAGGQLLYRAVVIVSRGKMEEIMNTTGFAQTFLMTMLVTFCVALLMWIVVPFDYKLVMLFPVFVVLGVAMGGFWPYVIKLTESITPVSGTISCVCIMLFGVGDTFIIFFNGELIEVYGAVMQPVPISISCLIGIPFLGFMLFLYRRYIKCQELAVKCEENVA